MRVTGSAGVVRDHRERDTRRPSASRRSRDARRGAARRSARGDGGYYPRSGARYPRSGVYVGGRIAYGSPRYAPSRTYRSGRARAAPTPPRTYEPEPPLPNFALGAFAGGARLGPKTDSEDLGVVGRMRLTDGLLVEGELSRGAAQGGERVDRQLGATLIFDTLPRRSLSPYFAGGLGAVHVQTASSAEAGYAYGEVGAGLAYRPTDRLELHADLRAGRRHTSEEALGGGDLAEEEDFARGRVGALIYF